MELRNLKLEIFKQEIGVVVNIISHFDDLRYRTKQLAITLWVAAIGFGLGQNLPKVSFLAAFVPLPFWILESFYSAYQKGFDERFWAINDFIRNGKYKLQNRAVVSLEGCFRDESFGDFPVPDYWGSRTIDEKMLKRATSTFRNFIDWRLALFYLPLIAVALLAALFR